MTVLLPFVWHWNNFVIFRSKLYLHRHHQQSNRNHQRKFAKQIRVKKPSLAKLIQRNLSKRLPALISQRLILSLLFSIFFVFTPCFLQDVDIKEETVTLKKMESPTVPEGPPGVSPRESPKPQPISSNLPARHQTGI